ncbi:hypothetical protein [Kamptonema formosum]|uniref:hypothetical protein n=1 Tax=Kamptonema formosum TaxID=331992 RepID=UPI0012DC4633|nr:hypothetical protein [Oscillatoria sp. PCC 10802]
MKTALSAGQGRHGRQGGQSRARVLGKCRPRSRRWPTTEHPVSCGFIFSLSISSWRNPIPPCRRGPPAHAAGKSRCRPPVSKLAGTPGRGQPKKLPLFWA